MHVFTRFNLFFIIYILTKTLLTVSCQKTNNDEPTGVEIDRELMHRIMNKLDRIEAVQATMENRLISITNKYDASIATLQSGMKNIIATCRHKQLKSGEFCSQSLFYIDFFSYLHRICESYDILIFCFEKLYVNQGFKKLSILNLS